MGLCRHVERRDAVLSKLKSAAGQIGDITSSVSSAGRSGHCMSYPITRKTFVFPHTASTTETDPQKETVGFSLSPTHKMCALSSGAGHLFSRKGGHEALVQMRRLNGG